MPEISSYHRTKTPFPKTHAQPSANLAKIVCLLLLSPFPFIPCGSHKRTTIKSYILRKFLRKNHKHNVKQNKNLEVSIQSSSSKQIKISSKSLRKNNCFIVKNKCLIATRSCFVPVTRRNSMQQNSGKQILHSLPKDERKHLLNQWYIA